MAQDLITLLGAIAPVIGWTITTPQLLQVIQRAEQLADGNAEAEMPIAVWLMWRAVLVALSVQVDFSADKASYKLSQMYENVKGFIASAFAEASPYLPEQYGGAFVGELKASPDPYAPIPPAGEFG